MEVILKLLFGEQQLNDDCCDADHNDCYDNDAYYNNDDDDDVGSVDNNLFLTFSSLLVLPVPAGLPWSRGGG